MKYLFVMVALVVALAGCGDKTTDSNNVFTSTSSNTSNTTTSISDSGNSTNTNTNTNTTFNNLSSSVFSNLSGGK